MSSFRPSLRIQAAGGREWEIYVYRARLPRLSLPDSGSSGPVWEYGLGGPILWALMELPVFIIRVAIALAIFLAALPFALVAAAQSPNVYVEAIDFSGAVQEAFVWTTARSEQEEVVEDVAIALRAGERPDPRAGVLVERRP